MSFIEDHLRDTLALYGNTHTEDDATGTVTSARLRAAVDAIRRHVHAGSDHRVICVGAGATAAVHLLQQILGVYLPPAGTGRVPPPRRRVARPGRPSSGSPRTSTRRRPVVFVGPYEHHSNEVSWRECFAEVVEIELTADGRLDLGDLEAEARPAGVPGPAADRRLLGGLERHRRRDARARGRGHPPRPRCPRLLRLRGVGPVRGHRRRSRRRAYFDAVYFSPHKFVGGPGAAGVLVIHRGLYRADLPPTVGAGGTVDFVNFDGQEYSPDIEIRETPGTPGHPADLPGRARPRAEGSARSRAHRRPGARPRRAGRGARSARIPPST